MYSYAAVSEHRARQTVALLVISFFGLCAPFQLQHRAFLCGRTHPFCQRFASSFMEFERHINHTECRF